MLVPVGPIVPTRGGSSSSSSSSSSGTAASSGSSSSSLACNNACSRIIDYRFLRIRNPSHFERTTIKHWQLRDLICCPSFDPNHVYFVQDSTVLKRNYLTNTTTSVQSLEFPPASMTVNCGFMAAGGQESQLVVRNLTSDTVHFNDSIGGTINNACHIAQYSPGNNRPSDIRLHISNNDNKIKVFSLERMDPIQDIRCSVSINNCAVSPDGTCMVAVGDDTNVLLFDVRNGYSQLEKLTGQYKDGGFSCSWNAYSNCFAVASQDGMVVIWDLRTRKVLSKMQSKQASQLKGACRTVKFSPTPGIDLLIFAEHVNYLHIIDTRNFEDHQIIHMLPSLPPGSLASHLSSNTDHHISGICFSPDSSRIFVGLESQIAELEVDSLRRRGSSVGVLL